MSCSPPVRAWGQRIEPPDSSTQPEPRPAIVKPLQDRLSREHMKSSSRRFPPLQVADNRLNQPGSAPIRRDHRERGGVSPAIRSLVRLMDPGRIEPEFGMLGCEPPGPVSLIPPLRIIRACRRRSRHHTRPPIP